MISCDFDIIEFEDSGAVLIWMKDDSRGIRAGIVPIAGGGLSSFQVRRRGKYSELLYRALDYKTDPPDGWEGRAPFMWPAVGRSYSPEQLARWKESREKPDHFEWVHDGRTYPMPMHGFARSTSWKLESAGHDKEAVWVDCSLKSSKHTAAMYPFQFDLLTRYLLKDGELVITYEVNAGDNEGPMPFSIGNHISFNMPMTGRGNFEDCAIRTPGDKFICMNALSSPSDRTEKVDLSNPTRLDNPDLLDNLLGGYGPTENWIEVIDPGGLRMHISHGEKSPRGPYASQNDYLFVFWGVKELNYFCPEPWVGLPNSLNTGRGIIKLPPKERFAWEVVLRPEIM